MSCRPASLGRASGSSLFAHRRVDHTFCNSVFPGSVEGACEVRNPHNSKTPSVLGAGGVDASLGRSARGLPVRLPLSA